MRRNITKREVLSSISIIAILLLVGVLISGKISECRMDKNEVYNKAVKMENPDMFEYGMRTNVGNAFVYGDLKAIDTVTYDEIGGSYMYVKKIKEEYTRHTRRVAHTKTVNGKTKTYYTTEVYWTWDEVWREHKKCKEISFCNVTFSSNKITLPWSHYIDTIKESSHVRYKYYGTDVKHTGTIFTELRNGTISDNSGFHKDMDIEATVKSLESWNWNFIFWPFWILLICACVVGFYHIENKWLE